MPQPFGRILICDDDLNYHETLKYALKDKYECLSARNSDEALSCLNKFPVDLLLLDIQMRRPKEGLEVIPKILERFENLPVVMISGSKEFDDVREAMKLGATDYVPKDFEIHDLLHTIEQAIEKRRLIHGRDVQNAEALRLQNRNVLIGESPAIRGIREMIQKIKNSGATVLINGETGTGKEVVARQLRRTTADGTLEPFVAVDSSTIQSTMAESLLFGHERGAFTGADCARRGIFEEADGGVVYFDEIGNMPLEIQAKLLRVLQEKEICRLGSTRVIPLSFRVIAATNRKLDALVAGGLFKPDLAQRLNVIPVDLPPLRDRAEDIPLLVDHFCNKLPDLAGRFRLTNDAVEALQAYPWPGNVRELINVLAYVATVADSSEIDVADLPPRLRDGERRLQAPDIYSRVADFEKQILEQEYGKCAGNISRLALNLGMDRSHLYKKLREYGIHPPQAR